jgi:hypothetical protein
VIKVDDIVEVSILFPIDCYQIDCIRGDDNKILVVSKDEPYDIVEKRINECFKKLSPLGATS